MSDLRAALLLGHYLSIRDFSGSARGGDMHSDGDRREGPPIAVNSYLATPMRTFETEVLRLAAVSRIRVDECFKFRLSHCIREHLMAHHHTLEANRADCLDHAPEIVVRLD